MDASDWIDRLEIRRVVESWAVFRDAGMFDRLAELWHEDGQMATTWAQAPAAEFVRLSRTAMESGVRVSHALVGFDADVLGSRAVAQTKMRITQRAVLDGVECDAVCDGRFYDLFERRAGAWKIVLRQPIYERDRLETVRPGPAPALDLELLAAFPDGYRHLAYLQTKLGMTVKRDMPGLIGPVVEALYARGAAWLSGGPSD